MISDKYAKKIDLCIEGDIPFALIFMPGETMPLWFSPDDPDSSPGDFAVRPFGITHHSPPMWMMAGSGPSCPPALHKPYPTPDSTTYDEYMRHVRQIADTLKRTGGKTVLSRLIAADSSARLTDVLERYFSKFDYTMRFVYNFPQTGIWLGASPELLADYREDSSILHTMSLAGTRRTDTPGGWDHKNLAEHQFVTDYITDTLSRYGLEVEITDSSPLRFGAIEHLCDRITARGQLDPTLVVDALSPTPALCGTPRDEAYRQIISTERHSRHCYGGWIGIRTPGRFTAYVNLRSALVAPMPYGGYRYNIYVGGGITADSDPTSEWQETCDKAAPLLSVLDGRDALGAPVNTHDI